MPSDALNLSGEAVAQNLDKFQVLFDTVIEFVVSYGLQIMGALFVFVVGVMVANWAARKMVAWGEKRNFDPTICKFTGVGVRIVLVAVVVIITLGNFGIEITPFVALAGAGAFGASLAIQGMLSNFGAGLAIILGRPFVVGSTIEVRNTAGVVHEIKLGQTILIGANGEKITIPNKQIIGEIVVDSHNSRVVETRLVMAHDQDVDKAIGVIKDTVTKFAIDETAPEAQVGVHGFGLGGIVLGARFWVPSLEYYRQRYAVNRAILKALEAAGVRLVPSGGWPVWIDPRAQDSDPVEGI